MIRRLQPGYKAIGAVHTKEADRERTRYCQRCEEMFGVQARLGPRIRIRGSDGKIEPPQPGDEQFLTCRNCGSTYPKHETRIEAEIGPIKEPSTGQKGKVQGIENKRKPKGRGHNPRLKGNKWEIKDSELNAELKSGAVLLAYSSNDPTEPIV
jgi:DNA-directed RNA polymerase subunit M/transcription elongation factor TFIIS